MICAFEDALSRRVTSPAWTPAAFGSNTALTVQPPPAAISPPQLLLAWNRPDATTEPTETAVTPVLVRLTVCGGLVVPTNCAAENLSGVLGEKLNAPVFSSVMAPVFLSRYTISGL